MTRAKAGFDPAESGSSEASWSALLAQAAPPAWVRDDPGIVVVVAPHPDDETLGAGGMLYDLNACGWRVTVVAVTDGEAADGREHRGQVERLRRRRPLEQSRAVFCLSRDADIIRLGIPDGEVASCGERLQAALLPLARRASLLVSTWRGDGHPDHEAAGLATARIAAEARVSLAEFPIWAWHWGCPEDLPVARFRGWRLSVDALGAKRRALRAYTSQIAPAHGFPVLPDHVLARFFRPVEAFLV